MDGKDQKGLQQLFEAAAGEDGEQTLSIDVQRYQHMIDDPSLSEDQKRQILEALWGIIVAFVEFGYGVHPAQEVCGKDEKQPEEQDKNAPNEVTSRASSKMTDDHDAPGT